MRWQRAGNDCHREQSRMFLSQYLGSDLTTCAWIRIVVKVCLLGECDFEKRRSLVSEPAVEGEF